MLTINKGLPILPSIHGCMLSPPLSLAVASSLQLARAQPVSSKPDILLALSFASDHLRDLHLKLRLGWVICWACLASDLASLPVSSLPVSLPRC